MRRAFLTILLFLIPMIFSGCFKNREAFVIKDIRVATDHLSEPRLRFQGVPHLDKAGVYSWKSASTPASKTTKSSRRQWRYVVPVTGAGWDVSHPVPLWVSFKTGKEDIRSKLSGLANALRRGSIEGRVADFPSRTIGVLRGQSAWQSAVVDAETKYGIRSHPKAPIIVWDETR